MARPNVLFVTLDQLRADSLGIAGHPLVATPNLDRLAAEGVHLRRHHSQAAPCGPGRASLYTGLYQHNHRVVGNGTPLDRRFDNVALAARRAGYDPVLFGYTDQAFDPRDATGEEDPRWRTYEGILPGFRAELDLPSTAERWLAWLDDLGHDTSGGAWATLAGESSRPAELSISAFTTDAVVEWLRRQDEPWFAHVSYLRPHPPYAAAGRWSTCYDPADVHLPTPLEPDPLLLHQMALQVAEAKAPTEEAEIRHLRAQYYGMISEVDDQLGRIWARLEQSGQWDDTVIVVTADHGDLLGDHGLVEKLGWWAPSYHVPAIVRDPRHRDAHGTGVDAFTENVDLFPTICEAIEAPVPTQCDGVALTAFLRGEDPEGWRTAAHWEWDWREHLIALLPDAKPPSRTLETFNLAVACNGDAAYVHIGDGSWFCYDLAADPTWRTRTTNPDVVLPLAQEMLTWRQTHQDRTWSNLLVDAGPNGHWPVPVPR